MVEISLGVMAVCTLVQTILMLVRETHDHHHTQGENAGSTGENRGKKRDPRPRGPKTPAEKAQKWLNDRKGGR